MDTDGQRSMAIGHLSESGDPIKVDTSFIM